MCRRCITKYGPVYRDHMFGVRSVVMIGPEANELVMDFDEHRLHRKALGVAFKPARRSWTQHGKGSRAQDIESWLAAKL